MGNCVERDLRDSGGRADHSDDLVGAMPSGTAASKDQLRIDGSEKRQRRHRRHHRTDRNHEQQQSADQTRRILAQQRKRIRRLLSCTGEDGSSGSHSSSSSSEHSNRGSEYSDGCCVLCDGSAVFTASSREGVLRQLSTTAPTAPNNTPEIVCADLCDDGDALHTRPRIERRFPSHLRATDASLPGDTAAVSPEPLQREVLTQRARKRDGCHPAETVIPSRPRSQVILSAATFSEVTTTRPHVDDAGAVDGQRHPTRGFVMVAVQESRSMSATSLHSHQGSQKHHAASEPSLTIKFSERSKLRPNPASRTPSTTLLVPPGDSGTEASDTTVSRAERRRRHKVSSSGSAGGLRPGQALSHDLTAASPPVDETLFMSSSTGTVALQSQSSAATRTTSYLRYLSTNSSASSTSSDSSDADDRDDRSDDALTRDGSIAECSNPFIAPSQRRSHHNQGWCCSAGGSSASQLSQTLLTSLLYTHHQLNGSCAGPMTAAVVAAPTMGSVAGLSSPTSSAAFASTMYQTMERTASSSSFSHQSVMRPCSYHNPPGHLPPASLFGASNAQQVQLVGVVDIPEDQYVFSGGDDYRQHPQPFGNQSALTWESCLAPPYGATEGQSVP